MALFHTVSTGAPGGADVNEVPPTPVTSGWSEGSSTASCVAAGVAGDQQSLDPLSPDAARIDCP